MLSNADYPIAYYATPAEDRNRLTVFFRLFIVFPHLIVMGFIAIALVFTIPVSWFALLFTGRYPRGLYDFHAGFLRLATRVNAYAALQTDKYPGFGFGEDPDYPVVLRIAPPAESYSRWKVLLRYFLAIPFSLVAQAYFIVTMVFAIATWFQAVFTGRSSFHRFLNWGLAANARVSAYMPFLLTEEWPPFEPDSGHELPAGPSTPLIAPEAP